MSDEHGGIQVTESVEIPALHNVTDVPAAAEARDALLRAIGQEARHVADKSAGHASTALVELARAYTLVTGGVAPGLPAGAGSGTGVRTAGRLLFIDQEDVEEKPAVEVVR
ncbi:hypothetical protein [Streptomyces lavendofoliae]|uniref:Uncharacterized protein n=1 Tax=Streptomyces lavendofoliae TaxID=67314 RepID=A0A918M8E2_9ACTN|nr:hypothetical protein [Streptomyces lavendofoliae]GGU67023.1 hypothetical protein GCM10010274_64410 [Streptomyces lavendofoliae]